MSFNWNHPTKIIKLKIYKNEIVRKSFYLQFNIIFMALSFATWEIIDNISIKFFSKFDWLFFLNLIKIESKIPIEKSLQPKIKKVKIWQK